MIDIVVRTPGSEIRDTEVYEVKEKGSGIRAPEMQQRQMYLEKLRKGIEDVVGRWY